MNEKIEAIFSSIEQSSIGTHAENAFNGLFDKFNINSTDLGSTVIERNQKLLKIMETIKDIDLGDINDSSNDIFGDAYEYLMGMYAANTGKSGGGILYPTRSIRIIN